MSRFRRVVVLGPVFLLSLCSAALADEELNTDALEGEIKYAAANPAVAEMVSAAQEFMQELKYAEKILAIDGEDWNYRRGLLRQAMSVLDITALRENRKADFQSSLTQAREILKPVEKVAKSYTIHLIGYSHIDLAWLWPWSETVEVFKNTSESVLKLMDEFPDFIFSQSQSHAYRWMEELHPDVFRRIKQKVDEGKWELIGGTWSEHDSNIPWGESFARQFLYGKLYMREKFGKDVKIGWTPDSFGYNWNLAQFLYRSGMEGFLTQKINWNDTNKFPYNYFWWEAPDGSKVLTYFPVGSYNENVDPNVMLDQLAHISRRHGVKELVVIYGVGDHGGGPTRDMLLRAEKLRKTLIYPTVVYSTAANVFKRLHELAKEKQFPVVRDELYLEYHRGTFTTQAKTKWNMRKSEILLQNAEKFSILAEPFGFAYPKEHLGEAWRLVLFNQMHDILPGSSISQVYKDSAVDFEKVFAWGNEGLSNAVKTIAKNIRTQGEGQAVVLFNPLTWARDDVVELQVDAPSAVSVVSHDGKPVPVQPAAGEKKIIFVAKKAPSLGYAVYRLKTGGVVTQFPPQFTATKQTLESQFFKVTISPETGDVSQIYDKQTRQNLLKDEGGNVLQLIEDNPREYDAWNIGTGRLLPKMSAKSIELVESGPVRSVVRVTKEYLKQKFTQDIIIYENLPRIDFRLSAFWRMRRTMLKVAFFFNMDSDSATFEIPYASVQRSAKPKTPQERARWEVSGHKWVDYTDKSSLFGVSLLNEAKYGFDVKDNVLRMTLLRSPIWPDLHADRGEHLISYALFPHAGDWKTANTAQKGWEFNAPLIVHAEENHSGNFPPVFSFAKASPDNVILAVLKKAEDGKGLILRVYETEGKGVTAKIELYLPAKTIVETNFLEESLGKPEKAGKSLSVKIAPFEVKTYRVLF